MAAMPGIAAVVHPHALLTQAQFAARSVTTNAAAAQQLRAVSADASARKLAGKKRKTQDKAAGEKAVHLIPESALFNSLVMEERELDYQIKRRRTEIQQAAAPYDHPVQKRLRIYIYTTHNHQPASDQQAKGQQQHLLYPRTSNSDGPRTSSSSGSASSSLQEPPQWTLNLWGRLVDMNDPPAAPGSAAADMLAAAQASATPLVPGPPNQQQQHSSKHHPFTSFFKRIEVQLDPDQYPQDAGLFVWEKFQHRGPHKDKLEIKRMGSSNVQVSIQLEQEFMPQAYKLAPELAELIGVTIGQQNSILSRVWTYINKQKTQEHPLVLQLDDKMAAVLGSQQLPRDGLPAAVGKLLKPIEPIKLDYTIDVSGASPGNVTCLDVDVLLPIKVLEKVVPGIDALLEDKQFEAIDQKQAAQLIKLNEARRRRAMYLGYAESPVAFINAAIASQARELRVARTGASKEAELERRTDVFSEKWVEEAAAKYLGKKNNAQGFF